MCSSTSTSVRRCPVQSDGRGALPVVDTPAWRRTPADVAEAHVPKERRHRRWRMDKCPEGISSDASHEVFPDHSQSDKPPLSGKAEGQRSSRAGSSSRQESDVIDVAAHYPIQRDDVGSERSGELRKVTRHDPELGSGPGIGKEAFGDTQRTGSCIDQNDLPKSACLQLEPNHADPATHVQQRVSGTRDGAKLLENQLRRWIGALTLIARSVFLGTLRIKLRCIGRAM